MPSSLGTKPSAPAATIRRSPASRMASSIVAALPRPMPQLGRETKRESHLAQTEGRISATGNARPCAMATIFSLTTMRSPAARCGATASRTTATTSSPSFTSGVRSG